MRLTRRKKSKYHNIVRKLPDGTKIDSGKEERRFKELKMLEKAGVIKDLRRQVRFELIPTLRKDGKCLRDEHRKIRGKVTKYVADFVYTENGQQVVEDVKGFKTEIYRLKYKLMYWRYGIQIKEV